MYYSYMQHWIEFIHNKHFSLERLYYLLMFLQALNEPETSNQNQTNFNNSFSDGEPPSNKKRVVLPDEKRGSETMTQENKATKAQAQEPKKKPAAPQSFINSSRTRNGKYLANAKAKMAKYLLSNYGANPTEFVLTFAEQTQDIAEVQNEFKLFMQRLRRALHNTPALCGVYEHQSEAQGWHIHLIAPNCPPAVNRAIGAAWKAGILKERRLRMENPTQTTEKLLNYFQKNYASASAMAPGLKNYFIKVGAWKKPIPIMPIEATEATERQKFMLNLFLEYAPQLIQRKRVTIKNQPAERIEFKITPEFINAIPFEYAVIIIADMIETTKRMTKGSRHAIECFMQGDLYKAYIERERREKTAREAEREQEKQKQAERKAALFQTQPQNPPKIPTSTQVIKLKPPEKLPKSTLFSRIKTKIKKVIEKIKTFFKKF